MVEYPLTRALGAFLILGAQCFLLAGCLGPSGASGIPGTVKEKDPQELKATVKVVVGADRALLWRATHDYLAKRFPLDVDDDKKQVVETKTLEWKAGRFVYRTRITAQVAPVVGKPQDARLGVVAELIQPAALVDSLSNSHIPPGGWILTGSHKEMEQFVVDHILARYLLLKEGRNPDLVAPQSPLRKR